MSTNFRDRAIAEVQKAIAADHNKEYQKAFDLYMSSMELWVKALKWEKNKALKATMQEKMATYLDRAEKLKQFLQSEADTNANGGKALMGVNGSTTAKSKGVAEDDDSKKLRNALSGAILQERPNVRWEDIAGLEGAKETLKEAVVLPIKFPSLFQGKRQAWKGILLYGPPGTGKSYLAKAVATEANSTFFSISSSDLVSKWMGESERLVKLLFSMARENKPSVIFIDEIDALCGPRGEGESEASRRIKTEILVQMDGVGNDSKGILVLGATNIPWQLDAAIRRRFQRRVHIGLPDLNGRARMFKLAVGDTETALQANDFGILASQSDGFSGSDISNVVQHALMRPVRKILQATHFKPVMKDGKRMLTPCSPGDPQNIEMTYDDVTSDELLPPDVAIKDFELALQDSHPTVSKEDIERQIEWTNEFDVYIKHLRKTGYSERGRKKNKDQLKDPRRVNIVNPGLCDDIIDYIGPSLERHRGCDLIDINPGVCLWSERLHKFLEPRKHILLEPDVERYADFLRPLLAKPQVTLTTKSGLVWKDLVEVIATELPQQRPMDHDAVPTRNDTLLVTANLSTFPKKAHRNFDSISTMVIYQFLSSIRTSSLFQRYGLVRMLLWIDDDEKKRLLPRSVTRRRRSAFELETSCEWFREVASLDTLVEDRLALRDKWINVESGCNVIKKMEAQGLQMPADREPKAYSDLKQEFSKYADLKLAGVRLPWLPRPFKQELDEIDKEMDDSYRGGLSGVRWRRRVILRKLLKLDDEGAQSSLRLLQQAEVVSRLATESPSEFEAANAAWNEEVEKLKKNQRMNFNSLKNNLHIFRRDPPALHWDRRVYEPLTVRANEFYPSEAPTALLDIQPKAMHPLLRQYGIGTDRSGDVSDVMLRKWFLAMSHSMHQAMDTIWPGASELVAQCPSMTDARRGGSPMTGHGSLKARVLTEEQWIEMVQAWMDWPFRPTYEHFHFPCIDHWLRVDGRRSCPVCKATVSRAEYGRGGRGCEYGPLSPQRRRRRRVPTERDEPDGLSFRRHVYLGLRYSLYVGSNRRSRYRELDRVAFRRDQGLQSRAKAFLRRELRVFYWLTGPDSPSSPSSQQQLRRRRPTATVERLVGHMIFLLCHFEIRGNDGALEDIVTTYLGRDNARLLLHELHSFLRSPFESPREWDVHVQYPSLDARPAER
ncbi:hypothetical protein CP532_3875 [Ophiocordyceps camponoti-leonardi (nom. inval.)]|nr:hypothetical protein CP532_3875 [Ophiocordyceps camponoti-leonardi (nom. inval.)]